MKHFINCLLLLVVLLGSDSKFSAQTPGSQSTSKQVEVYFTALGKDKKPVTDLNKEDIELLENGAPQQIESFALQADAPIAVSILIDTSLSQEERIAAERTAALSLINSILRPGKDSGLVATFTNSVNVEQAFTSDLKSLQSAAYNFKYVVVPKDAGGLVLDKQDNSYTTALYDAIWITCEYILPQGPAGARKIIIILSDGNDTTSQKKLDEAVERAIRAQAAVFLLRLGEKQGIPAGGHVRVETLELNASIENRVKRLFSPTGGRVFTPKNDADLQSAIKQLAQEAHNQYRITYTPKTGNPGNRYKKLEIKVINPDKKKLGLDVTYPKAVLGAAND